LEANDLTETTTKRPVVRFANTTESNSEDISTDKILSGIEKVLRAVEQKTPSPASSSNASLTSENSASSRVSSNNSNGNGRNRSNRSNGRRNNGFRNRNSSSEQESRDPNVNGGNRNVQSPHQEIQIMAEMVRQSVTVISETTVEVSVVREIFGGTRIIPIHPVDISITNPIHVVMVREIMVSIIL